MFGKSSDKVVDSKICTREASSAAAVVCTGLCSLNLTDIRGLVFYVRLSWGYLELNNKYKYLEFILIFFFINFNETIHFTFLVKLDILKYASTILRSQCIYLEQGSLPIYLSLSIENCLKISWRETRRIETRYLTKIKMLSLVDNFWLPDLQQSQWIIKGKIFFSFKNKRHME